MFFNTFARGFQFYIESNILMGMEYLSGFTKANTLCHLFYYAGSQFKLYFFKKKPTSLLLVGFLYLSRVWSNIRNIA